MICPFCSSPYPEWSTLDEMWECDRCGWVWSDEEVRDDQT
jgi:ribosomal protein L37AE/L43A